MWNWNSVEKQYFVIVYVPFEYENYREQRQNYEIEIITFKNLKHYRNGAVTLIKTIEWEERKKWAKKRRSYHKIAICLFAHSHSYSLAQWIALRYTNKSDNSILCLLFHIKIHHSILCVFFFSSSSLLVVYSLLCYSFETDLFLNQNLTLLIVWPQFASICVCACM